MKHLSTLLICLLIVACQSDTTPTSPLPTTIPTAQLPVTTISTSPPNLALDINTTTPPPSPPTTIPPTNTPVPLPTLGPTNTPLPSPTPPLIRQQLVGFTSSGNAINAWHIGTGPHNLLFIGGHHGGYEWNTIILAYEIIDYFTADPSRVPAHITLTIIPSANPDGQKHITGTAGRFTPADIKTNDTFAGRFNADGVDLNRNWDCNWQTDTRWRDQTITGGGGPFPFSAVENQHLRHFIDTTTNPELVVWWHSAADAIFLGQCNGQQAPQTLPLAQTYSQASNYPIATGGFTAYPITGDASDYLNAQGIPSFAIELRDHTNTDFDDNLAGILALFDYYQP
ncbi:MAG TPA: M14 family metallopeptidase [Anaerolineae bacterium]|nr:M14 family metallopeptidase [Anaerolineae bacterium]